jgi:hypothetical protein
MTDEDVVLVRNAFTQIGDEEGWALYQRGDEIVALEVDLLPEPIGPSESARPRRRRS